MRKLFTLLLFCTGFIGATAQNECAGVSTLSGVGCGAGLKAPDRDKFVNYYSKVDPSILYQRGSIQWIPIRYHIITKDNGACGADLRKILETHCEMNEVFQEFNIGFFISAIDTIKDTYIWTFDNEAIGPITFAQYNDTNVLNVYVNGNLPGLCGFATLPQYDPRGGGVFMHKDCMGTGDKTLHHEVGHYLSLIHTFETVLGVELVNGSNCANSGDLICDTPADFPDHTGACPYLGSQKDSNGDYYRSKIDPSIFMSYFDNHCKSRFTPMQRAAMVTNLNTVRTYLLTIPTPDLSPLDSAVFTEPFSNISANSTNLTFRWNTIPRAAFYRFTLASATSREIIFDTLMRDTVVYMFDLITEKGYKYIVRPIGYGNTCAELATWHYIETAKIQVDIQVVSPLCYSNPDDTIIATAKNGTPPYTFYWSNGLRDSMLTNVSAGDYVVTITDYNNKSVIERATVIFPEPFSADIHATPNNLVATGTGGTPPYTYQWSNGGTNRFYNFPQFGNYSVTITDSRGCSAISDFVYLSAGVIQANKVAMHIFPNPANNASVLNIQLDLPQHAEGTISLINVSGQVIQQLKRDFPSGLSNCQLSVTSIPAGIYFVKFSTSEIVKTERFSLIK